MQFTLKMKANLTWRITNTHADRRTSGCTCGSNGKKKTSSITRNRYLIDFKMVEFDSINFQALVPGVSV